MPPSTRYYSFELRYAKFRHRLTKIYLFIKLYIGHHFGLSNKLFRVSNTPMQNIEEKHPNNSIINLAKQKPKMYTICTNESTITIDTSQLDITIKGNHNRIKFEDSAGKVKIKGKENQVEIRKSWISC